MSRALKLFVALQVGDLAVTLLLFRAGGGESNPLILRLIAYWSLAVGLAAAAVLAVLAVKIVAVLIAFRFRRLLWVANLYYTGVVVYNVYLLNILMKGV